MEKWATVFLDGESLLANPRVVASNLTTEIVK